MGVQYNYQMKILYMEEFYMTRLHFETQEKAWNFIMSISGKTKVLDYGIDRNRMVNIYYVEVE